MMIDDNHEVLRKVAPFSCCSDKEGFRKVIIATPSDACFARVVSSGECTFTLRDV